MGTWTTIELDGKPAEVFDADRTRFGLIYLHGAGRESLSDQPAYTKLFDELGLSCVRPAGGSAWWSDRLCPEYDRHRSAAAYVMEAVLPFVRTRWSLGSRSVGLFGISMGGQGALRLAFQHPEEFRVVAGISSAIDYHEHYGQGTPLDEMYASREHCRQDTALMHIDPAVQPPHIYFCCDPDDVDWHRGNDRLHEKLAALGVAHTCDLTTQAGGHTWEYYNSVADRVIRFLAAGLEQESRRLL
jgi:S-formylglutathione hydrolase